MRKLRSKLESPHVILVFFSMVPIVLSSKVTNATTGFSANTVRSKHALGGLYGLSDSDSEVKA